MQDQYRTLVIDAVTHEAIVLAIGWASIERAIAEMRDRNSAAGITITVELDEEALNEALAKATKDWPEAWRFRNWPTAAEYLRLGIWKQAPTAENSTALFDGSWRAKIASGEWKP